MDVNCSRNLEVDTQFELIRNLRIKQVSIRNTNHGHVATSQFLKGSAKTLGHFH